MSPYFDGCYFDPAYFDADPCVPPVPTTGGHPKGWTRRKGQAKPVDIAEPLTQDDDDLFAGVL